VVSSVQDKWSLVLSGANSGSFNMSLDDYLAKNPNGISSLRIYEWNPQTISLGYHQSPEILDLSKIGLSGIGLVRRPTGGRAIFHAEEITYSLILNGNNAPLARVYEKIHTAIAQALSRIKIESDLVMTKNNRDELSPRSDRYSCFTSSARTELEYMGKKIVGSAGKRYNDSLLIHGSILLGDAHKKIIEYYQLTPSKKSKIQEDLDSKTSSLESILGTKVKKGEFIDFLIESFAYEFKISFEQTDLDDQILYNVQELEDNFNLLNNQMALSQ